MGQEAAAPMSLSWDDPMLNASGWVPATLVALGTELSRWMTLKAPDAPQSPQSMERGVTHENIFLPKAPPRPMTRTAVPIFHIRIMTVASRS